MLNEMKSRLLSGKYLLMTMLLLLLPTMLTAQDIKGTIDSTGTFFIENGTDINQKSIRTGNSVLQELIASTSFEKNYHGYSTRENLINSYLPFFVKHGLLVTNEEIGDAIRFNSKILLGSLLSFTDVNIAFYENLRFLESHNPTYENDSLSSLIKIFIK